ncbi:DUF1716-domain-containing protein [Annulohypoxylon maeteangense]|uniref:DUF1716-domain-containing protein n=1 Tax=Annulohypoxylon maeteangense TaxID=1927788 RepID=UPI0020086E4C|nr:DUF1716-domain-containing protein [Annulohypoxylon maeteangense]KAI0880703.1 DUF1716-domain-containing protein [Annulohypoxylon maeteangense]
MANIDDLFKASGAGSKRKLEPLRDPNEIYKSARLTSNGSSSRHASVEEIVDVDDDDTEAGPSLPPDEEDEFGGSGLTAQEEDALDYIDALDPANDQQPIKFDNAWLRKTAINFEKCINKNAELRAKYENDPEKFADSENHLDQEIRSLSILSEQPELYTLFVKLGSVASLVSLLAHENTDIAIDAVEVINELTDEEVVADEEQWDTLADALLEDDLLGLLVSNFERFDEKEESDQKGVYYALGIIENLCSGRTATKEKFAENDKLLKWLLRRVQAKETKFSQNKQYVAEILAILMQDSPQTRRRLAGLDAMEILLQLSSAYRRRDPEKGGYEEEYMENLFEALTSLADEPEGKTKFVEADGPELCLLMLKDGNKSKASALRLLTHAVGGSGAAGVEVCQKVVKDGGLKVLFTLFMKKKNDRATMELLISIFGSLLRLLPADSDERIRALAKFVEKDYEKTTKLIKIRRDYATRMNEVEEEIEEEKRTADRDWLQSQESEWFLRRLDAGLFCLQTIDVILAWLIAEDNGAKKTIRKLLADHDETFDAIRNTLQEQIKGIEAQNPDKDPWDLKEMLSTLVKFLQ